MPGLRVFQRSLAPPTTPPEEYNVHPQTRPKDHLAAHGPPQISPLSSLPSSNSITPTSSRPNPTVARPAPAGSVEPPSQGVGEGRRVMSRLHALFNVPGPEPDSLARVKTAPPIPRSDTLQTVEPQHVLADVKDRDAIKVLIVTWNMGETLPKGDLAVLLGEVPAYDGAHSTGALPELAAEPKHPYHIVVIAGQECPTDSGVPRGWGGGLMKGVRAAHKKHHEKLKEMEKGKEEDKSEVLQEDEGPKAGHGDSGEDQAGHEDPEPGKADEAIREEDLTEKEREKLEKERVKKEAKEKEKQEKERKAQEKKEKEELDKARKEKEKHDKKAQHQHSTEIQKIKDEENGLGLETKSPVSPHSPSPHSSLIRPTNVRSDDASSTDGNAKSPAMDDDDDDDRRSRGVSPSPSMDRSHGSLSLHKPVHHPGSKGWSTMLDDWFCGPSARRPDQSQDESQTNPNPSPVPLRSASAPMSPPQMNRSVSAPANPSLSPPQNLSTSPKQLAVPLSRSPLSRALSSQDSLSDSSSGSSPQSDIPHLSGSPPSLVLPLSTSGTAPINIPGRNPNSHFSGYKVGTTPDVKLEMPEIIVPMEDRRTVGGEKCYLHLIKERLMGMYLSVYVYKGCEHLIQGVDKDFVTAGLAGGRVGNKGGIGISLKLADHRFLFVNSHLAAHTARVNARLANIVKIKSDLRLDTFLPKDDPLHELEDLTDRFDTVFWCGDLNFRLDLSRLHAEWLVEKKKYSEALMWDQLQNAMKDEKKNPFPGFEEHTIDFPPTFKYDVWRSVKSTNRELRRTIKRHGTVTSSHSKVPGHGEVPATPVRDDLTHIMEAHPDQERDSDVRSIKRERDSDEDTRTLSSRRSFDSSVYHSRVPSTAGTDMSDAESLYRQPVDSSAYGSKHKALEVAIKSKTKRLLGIVKMDGVFGHSPKRSSKRISRNLENGDGRPSAEFDAQSRRTSVSSIATMLSQDQHEAVLSKPPETPIDGGDGMPVVPEPNRPRAASSVSDAVPPKPRRKLTLKRAGTFRRRANTEGEDGQDILEDDDEFDETDRREGVYDSSKKQRVPSWCDRVLWKTRVTPDPPDEPVPEPEPDYLEPDNHLKPFNRLSQAFSNIGGHLRLPASRSATINPDTGAPSRLFSSVGRRASVERRSSTPPSTDSAGVSLLVTSPEASPMALPPERQVSPRDTSGMIPSPKRPLQALERPHLSRGRSSSASPHPLLDTVPTTSPPADPKVTFDPVVSAELDRSSSSATRRRANSDSSYARPNGLIDPDYSVTLSPTMEEGSSRRRSQPGPARQTSFPRQVVERNSSFDRKSRLGLRRTSGSLRLRKRTQTLDSVGSTSSRPSNLLRQSFAVPSDRDRDRDGDKDRREDDGNAFVKFFKDIQSFPNWLHRGSVPVRLEPSPEPESRPGRRRHQHGEVECLHYGTIDDAGMRQLEGRSDHRPAIFSAAVYV